MFAKFWTMLWSPSARFSLGVLLAAGGVGGVIFLASFNASMTYTNSLEFCISCHEMANKPYEEYKQSIHYTNASGVRAICSDCHVPHEFVPKMIRKVEAANEVYHWLLGTINTPEKFEEHRLEMAERVWAQMEANDSRECRSCHSWHAMDFTKQQQDAARQMHTGMEQGETCISCHKGIAHKLPDMSRGYLTMFEELKAQSAQEGARADTLTTIETKEFFAGPQGAVEDEAAGRLLAATKIDVVERRGDLLKVRIEGWQQDQVERVIYALRGQRIFSATLTPQFIPQIERHETEVDEDTELTWHRISLDVWVSKENLVSDTEPLWRYGAEMYNASCSTCHSLSGPGHLLANQWIGTLKAMQRFIVLDKEQYRFLQKYLQFRARDTGGNGSHV